MGRRSLSLITLVYNGGSALVDTLESVACQSVCPDEHVIVDGGSVDGSIDVCKAYAARVSYDVRLLHREPRGIYDALNYGLSVSKGDILGALHSGDCFASSVVLERVMKEFSSSESVSSPGFVYGDIVYMNRRGGRGRYYSGAYYSFKSLKRGYMCPHPTVYARRELFEICGLYNSAYKVAADFEWLVRVMLKAGECGSYLPLLMVKMQSGGISSKLYHRLFTTPSEKYRALRSNGVSVNPLVLAGRYFYAFKTIFGKRND